jgi:hypothetical protein
MKALLGETISAALAPVNDRLGKIEAEAAAAAKKLEASTAIIGKVEPHAGAIESCAAAMEAAGIGMHPDNGHVAHLRRMAAAMRVDAATGKVPHIFRDHDYPYSAAADKSADRDAAVAKAVEAAVKPLTDKLAEAETKIADLKAAATKAAPAPERKTVPPANAALLARASLTMPEGEGKLSVAALDKAMTEAGFDTTKRIQLKVGLDRAGLLG